MESEDAYTKPKMSSAKVREVLEYSLLSRKIFELLMENRSPDLIDRSNGEEAFFLHGLKVVRQGITHKVFDMKTTLRIKKGLRPMDVIEVQACIHNPWVLKVILDNIIQP